MSDEIKVGDLVMLVRAHCPSVVLGEIATVTRFETTQTICCADCGARLPITVIVWTDGRFRAPPSWLKRIPPLSELQSYRHTDENPIKVVT